MTVSLIISSAPMVTLSGGMLSLVSRRDTHRVTCASSLPAGWMGSGPPVSWPATVSDTYCTMSSEAASDACTVFLHSSATFIIDSGSMSDRSAVSPSAGVALLLSIWMDWLTALERGLSRSGWEEERGRALRKLVCFALLCSLLSASPMKWLRLSTSVGSSSPARLRLLDGLLLLTLPPVRGEEGTLPFPAVRLGTTSEWRAPPLCSAGPVLAAAPPPPPPPDLLCFSSSIFFLTAFSAESRYHVTPSTMPTPTLTWLSPRWNTSGLSSSSATRSMRWKNQSV